jgi:hypothetical protein
MFLSEVFDLKFNPDTFLNNFSMAVAMDVKTPRQRLIACIYGLATLGFINPIEDAILKRYWDKFVKAAIEHHTLPDIMKAVLTPEESEAVNAGLISYMQTMNTQDAMIYLGEKEHMVNQYYKIKQLGEGGFGTVFLALDNKNGNTVVIKVMENTPSSKNEYTDMLDVKSKCHEFFPCVIERIENGKLAYIVMESSPEYKDMFEYILDGRIPAMITGDDGIEKQTVVNVFSNIVRAVQYLHSIDMVHSDLKPENVLVNIETGDIKIIDFGVACRGPHCQIAPNEFKGTPIYFDPELHRKLRRGLTLTTEDLKRGDVWAVGMIIYAAITMNVPGNAYQQAGKIQTYFLNYSFEKDPKRDQINEVLAELPGNWNLDDFLIERQLPDVDSEI